MKEALEFLKSLYPNKKIEVLSKLPGGMMNKSFVVLIDNKKYVLYLPTKQANEMVDRGLEKENQKIVYDLDITSKNLYFDSTTGIKLNEYLEGSSLNNLSNDEIDIKKVAKLLKTLQNSPILSKKDYKPFERLVKFEKEKEEMNITDLKEYNTLRNCVFDHRSFLENEKKVLSHNDFQKSNIVKSNNEYFVIDFEFMMNNYQTYDIACYGNGDVKDGYDLLCAYFINPSKEQIKRYYLWRIFVSLQWYNVALIKNKRGEGLVHNIDFYEVAKFFLENAKEAYSKLID